MLALSRTSVFFIFWKSLFYLESSTSPVSGLAESREIFFFILFRDFCNLRYYKISSIKSHHKSAAWMVLHSEKPKLITRHMLMEMKNK